MAKQNIVILPLSGDEYEVVNARKRNSANHWTHKVVCGEHATFLQNSNDDSLAKLVPHNWPHVFSHVGGSLPSNAKPVEQADKRFLLALEAKFGNPSERRIEEANARIATLVAEVNKPSIFSRLFGKK